MKGRVLLVDPDRAALGVLVDLLSKEGYQMEEATGTQEVFRKLEETQYSMIFCHFTQSSKGHLDFLREMWMHVQLPCQIFATGPDDVRTAVQAMLLGARYYWSVPLSAEDLSEQFRNGVFTLDRSRWGYHREGTLLQIIKEIALTMELDGLMNILIDSAMELTQADGGALLFLNEKSKAVESRAVRGIRGIEQEAECFGVLPQRYYEILMAKNPVFLHPVDFTDHTHHGQKIGSIIVTPIWWKDVPLGEIVIAKLESSEPFTSDDFKVLSLLSEEISAAVFNAITHYKTKELTIKDDLTEAYNRRYFDQYLDTEFSRAGRYGSCLSLIFFDVDNLKEVNAKYGHLMGSKTLQEIARRMILAVRGIDKVVRYGGDEFCVVLPETDVQGAYQVAERIRQTIASRPFSINEQTFVSLTGSFGIACFPAHASTKEELIRQADQAMFAIKNKSKNAIAVAPEL